MSASVPIMITIAQRQRLAALGYTDAQINAMTPSEAYAILNGNGVPPDGASILDQINAMLDEAKVEPETEPESKPVFTPYTVAEWLERPPKQWLVEGFFGPGDLMQIYGASGEGKTFIVIDLLFAACTGGMFADRFAVSRPLTCAYAMSEGQDGFGQRLIAAGQHHGVESPPNLFLFELVPQLFERGADSISEFAREWREAQDRGERPQLDVLVIDTQHGAIVGGDENSAKDMGSALQALRLAAKLLGCAIVLVHHKTKDGSAERGSSALRGAMSAMIEIKKISGKYAMECSKLKDAERWTPQTFDLVKLADSVYVWWDAPSGTAVKETGEDERARQGMLDVMERYPDEWFTVSKLAEAIGKTDAHARRLLASLHEQGKCRREQGESRQGQKPWLYASLIRSNQE